MERFVPIGTIVKINGIDDAKYMIVGYLPKNQAGEMRDYSALPYPVGLFDSRFFIYFNSSDVEEVISMGYMDKTYEAWMEIIEAGLQKQKEKQTQGEC